MYKRQPYAWCVYLGVPLDHPLAGFDYDNIPLSVHGGLTFAREGEGGKYRPKGWYWYGWDYGHCDDASVYDFKSVTTFDAGKKWTLKEVKDEAQYAAWDFAKLKSLTERIANKRKENKDGT